MSNIGITLDEILLELERLQGETPDGFTVREMCQHFGRGTDWCRETLRNLIEAGRAECAGRRRITQMDGKAGLVPVYRFVDG